MKKHDLFAVGCAAACLIGCGGTEPDPAPAEPPPTRATAGPVNDPRALPTLLDDDGLIAPPVPRALPTDPGARTRTPRYALRAQAHALTAALGDEAVWVDAGCCGSHAVELVVDIAHAMVAAGGHRRDTPVFVHGGDPRVAAQVVDRLVAEGMRRTFLVTGS